MDRRLICRTVGKERSLQVCSIAFIIVALIVSSAAAAPAKDVAVHECPSIPPIGFEPNSVELDKVTTEALPDYAKTMKSDLWRSGWLTIEPVALNVADRSAVKLAQKREMVVVRAFGKFGVSRKQISFRPVNDTINNREAWINAYPTTLAVPEPVWKTMVSPGVEC